MVTQAETRDPYRALREDLTKTSTAYLVAELMDALTEEAIEQPELFDLLADTFRALGTTDDPRLLAVHFQVSLLDLAGFRPVLMQCVGCQESLLPGKNGFSAFLGGALCPRCSPSEPSARPIDTDVLKVLRNLQRAGQPGSARFRVPEVVMREVERVLRDLVERHTERRLRTPDLLARLRIEPSTPPASRRSPCEWPGASGPVVHPERRFTRRAYGPVHHRGRSVPRRWRRQDPPSRDLTATPSPRAASRRPRRSPSSSMTTGAGSSAVCSPGSGTASWISRCSGSTRIFGAKGTGASSWPQPRPRVIRRGCARAELRTFDFQAPAFYKKLGYEEFLVSEDFPRGHTRTTSASNLT